MTDMTVDTGDNAGALDAAQDSANDAVAANAGQQQQAQEADKGGGSILDGDYADEADGKDAGKQAGTWPEDWRQQIAGNDEKFLKRISRYNSPANIAKAFVELERKMSSGQYKKGLAADATPEEVAAWRKENGVPETPDGYSFDDLGDGYVLGEDDKPAVDAFREFAHGANMPPDQAKGIIKFYKQLEDKALADRLVADQQQKVEGIEQMRAELGPDFRSTISATNNLMTEMFGEEGAKLVQNARLPDGSVLANNPAILLPLAQFARNMGGYDLLPAGGGNTAKGLDARIAEIENTMNTNFPAYDRNPAMQQEYRELLAAREKRQGRAA